MKNYPTKKGVIKKRNESIFFCKYIFLEIKILNLIIVRITKNNIKKILDVILHILLHNTLYQYSLPLSSQKFS